MSAPPARDVHLVADASDDEIRLDQWLAQRIAGLSRSQAQRLIRDGHVHIAGTSKAARSSLPVWPGLDARVRLPAPASATPLPEALPLEVLYDDEDVVVVNKPAGMVVHPAAGHSSGTLVNALLHHVKGLSGVGGRERPGIVHRLDRGTSGVMVVAKHDTAHRALARQFHDRLVTKEYIALVWGTLREGARLTAPIGRDPRHRQKMSSRARQTRPAETRVVASEPLGGVSLVTVTIGTGRTHQIRVHLSEAGHPVVGDALYGGSRRSVPPRLAALSRLTRPFLHAATLGFTHPVTGQPLVFRAALADDLQAVVAAVRRAAGRSSPKESDA